jgi:hypothetical protein
MTIFLATVSQSRRFPVGAQHGWAPSRQHVSMEGAHV